MQPEVPDKATAPPELPPPVELEYSLDQDDWVHYYAYCWSQQPRPRFPIRLAITALVVPTVLTLPVLGILVGLPLLSHGTRIVRDPDVGPFFGVIALACLGFVLVVAGVIVLHARSKKQMTKVLRLQAEKQVRQSLLEGTIRLQEQRHVRITEEGFVEACEFRDTDGGVDVHTLTEFRVPWGAVEGIDVTERLALVLVAKKSALLVPRRIFADEAAFSGFLNTVASLRRRAAEAPTCHPVAGQEGKKASGVTLMPRPHPDDRITQ